MAPVYISLTDDQCKRFRAALHTLYYDAVSEMDVHCAMDVHSEMGTGYGRELARKTGRYVAAIEALQDGCVMTASEVSSLARAIETLPACCWSGDTERMTQDQMVAAFLREKCKFAKRRATQATGDAECGAANKENRDE